MSDVYKLKHLTGHKLKIFLAIADRIIPADDETPGGGTIATAAIVDWNMDHMPEALRKQLLMLFIGLDILGIFFGLKPFIKNSDSAKDRQIAWMESCPIPPLALGYLRPKKFYMHWLLLTGRYMAHH